VRGITIKHQMLILCSAARRRLASPAMIDYLVELG